MEPVSLLVCGQSLPTKGDSKTPAEPLTPAARRQPKQLTSVTSRMVLITSAERKKKVQVWCGRLSGGGGWGEETAWNLTVGPVYLMSAGQTGSVTQAESGLLSEALHFKEGNSSLLCSGPVQPGTTREKKNRLRKGEAMASMRDKNYIQDAWIEMKTEQLYCHAYKAVQTVGTELDLICCIQRPRRCRISHRKCRDASVFSGTLSVLCQCLSGDWNDFPFWISWWGKPRYSSLPQLPSLYGEDGVCVPCWRGFSRGEVENGKIEARFTVQLC